MKHAMVLSVALLIASVGLALVAGGASAPSTSTVEENPPVTAAAAVHIVPPARAASGGSVQWLEEVTIVGTVTDAHQPPGSTAKSTVLPAAAAVVQPR
ncbi:MAG TPA: hypothetical protein VKZ49_09870 [Polyangiaceae bacterium]|nr:hypothetical protein [Polyangiaceae bacterium]